MLGICTYRYVHELIGLIYHVYCTLIRCLRTSCLGIIYLHISTHTNTLLAYTTYIHTHGNTINPCAIRICMHSKANSRWVYYTYMYTKNINRYNIHTCIYVYKQIGRSIIHKYVIYNAVSASFRYSKFGTYVFIVYTFSIC